ADLAQEPRQVRTREAGGPFARLPVALDGEVVLAGELLHVTDPLEDRRGVQRTGAVARDPQRRGVQREGLGVRVERACAIPGPREPLEGFGRVLAALVVVREEVDEFVEAIGIEGFQSATDRRGARTPRR